MKHKVDTETVFLHVSLNIFLTVSFLGLQWSRKKKDFFMRTFETFKTYKLSDQMCVASYHAEILTSYRKKV